VKSGLLEFWVEQSYKKFELISIYYFIFIKK